MGDKSVALIFQPMLVAARQLAEQCRKVVEACGYTSRLVSAWELESSVDNSGIHLAVTFGGDGTIIRAARWLAGTGTPILGVAMGKLGFMTELPPETACDSLPAVLRGHYWCDERSMLTARVLAAPHPGEAEGVSPATFEPPRLVALNDVVVGRSTSLRVAHIDVFVDGVHLVHYVADGLIIATPTGSTAYSLAAGGPVLSPDVQGLVVAPVAAHLSVLRSLVVPATARIQVRASSDHPMLVVLDGQVQVAILNNQPVAVELAREKTIFARTGSRLRFYETLVQSLKKR